MNILISNDDGIFALGMRTLASTLSAAGHKVTVVCPDRERSATGHGLTMHKPIRAEMIESVFQDDIEAWSCSGTPADCVKLALGALMATPPEVVVSGINHGANLGTDVVYSGTVSAAMEGVMEGIPAIAVSLTSFTQGSFAPAADFIRDLLGDRERFPLERPMLLNVNVPAVTAAKIKGAKITRQGIRRYFDQFEKRLDPRGKTYYWLAGEAVEDIEDPLPNQGWPPDLTQAMVAIPTDVQAIRDRYISVTPLQYNLTAVGDLLDLAQGKRPLLPEQVE
ncbi:MULTISPECIES: 5'/3'-nucleotidase SurE [Cyanophyceae]|uniref:5'/3'-nucleotidase SurE n=1 Tax=Cyanophyceae TaxID=3028117 RepID=UPI0016884197|nr:MULTISPECIES: 5'/3'-nucleotidase SurE [Cyanophyceae]MBD1917518.1 5'/3'-nucleotidase SurE [Phormidium sp. FACHB-77]MBD2029607.1 5'/3'-nucleotidase SurE [Phormidium sp. FACHB-322]MBD2050868.1 5'/3'-nucleotidase SurE [Leptolyngbya sp. FACHB-60]